MKDDSALEAALRRVMQPREAKEAAERIARRLESRALPPQKRPHAWWPAALTDLTFAPSFAPAWPRIAALACAAVLGISIGLSSLGSRIAVDLDLNQVASADDSANSANSVFDPDVGMRP
ncbi:MAG: hypothetical protein JO000_29180 [Alphaproteobacteria bacterium]|nr:hypothetical protein [Alphaproteobacteria bacterium]